jgi:hypothetical protein
MSGAIAIGAAVAAVALPAALGAGEIFIAAAAIGGILGVVGTLTHTPALSIAGSVVGAVGAIGGLAVSSGLLDPTDLGIPGVGGTASSASPFATGAGNWADGAAAATGPSGINGADLGAVNFPTDTPFSLDNPAQVPGTTMPGGALPGNDAIATLNGTAPAAQLNNAGSVLPADQAQNTFDTLHPLPNATPAPATDQSILNNTTQNAWDTVQGTNNPLPPPSSPAAPTVNGPAAPGTGYAYGSATASYGMPGAGPTSVAPPPPTGSPAASEAGVNTAGIPNAPDFSMLPRPPAGTVPESIANPGSSPFSGIAGFLKSQGGGTLAAGALQAGMSFLSGATNQLTPAQIAAYNAQAQANLSAANLSNQQANLTAMQVSNMQQPLPVAHRVSTAPVTGLINQGAAT